MDDKAFQINVINSHRLEGRPTWEDQGVGELETITNPTGQILFDKAKEIVT